MQMINYVGERVTRLANETVLLQVTLISALVFMPRCPAALCHSNAPSRVLGLLLPGGSGGSPSSALHCT